MSERLNIWCHQQLLKIVYKLALSLNQFSYEILAGLIQQLPKHMVESGYTIWLVLIILIVLLIYFLTHEGVYENIKAHPKAVTVAIFVLATLLFFSLAALAHTEQARNQESTAVNKLIEELKANRKEHADTRQDLKETIRTVMSEATNSKELTVVADQLAYMNKMNDKTLEKLDKTEKKYETLSEQLENCRAQEKTCAIERSEFKLKNKICQDKLADS